MRIITLQGITKVLRLLRWVLFPCLSYPSNAIIGNILLAAMLSIRPWVLAMATGKNEWTDPGMKPKGLKDFLTVSSKTTKRLWVEIRPIAWSHWRTGDGASPDTRHVDYDVIPIIVAMDVYTTVASVEWKQDRILLPGLLRVIQQIKTWSGFMGKTFTL